MRHEDFTSLDLGDVLPRILTFCRTQTGAAAVHWISTHGLERIAESTKDNWHWAFAGAEIANQHVISEPAADSWALFQLWNPVAALFPKEIQPPLSPHALQPGLFVCPVVYAGTFYGLLMLEKPSIQHPVELSAKLRPALEVGAKYIAFSYQHLNSRNLSYVDEVTGLYNQRYLPMVLEHEIERSRRDSGAFSLLFMDIDYFKLVNDGRGHWVGSKLLLEVAKILKRQVRACDYAFRYGGDEFIVLLGGSNAQDSQKVAERIRKAIEGHTFLVEGHSLNLTVSIGLAAYPDHAQSAAGLIQLADQAMYYGKRKSRNIVFVAS